MDAGTLTAVIAWGTASGLVLTGMLGKPAYLLAKLAVLWLAWLAVRPSFRRSWTWRYRVVSRVRRHRPARAWADRGLWADAAAQLHATAQAALVQVRAAAPRPLYGRRWVTA